MKYCVLPLDGSVSVVVVVGLVAVTVTVTGKPPDFCGDHAVRLLDISKCAVARIQRLGERERCLMVTVGIKVTACAGGKRAVADYHLTESGKRCRALPS